MFMKSLVLHTTQFILLTALLVFALGVNYLYAAWSGPPAGLPPSNCTPGYPGCDAPVNVGTAPQVKDGNLSVGNSGNATSTVGFSVVGRMYTTGWLKIGAAGGSMPAQPLDIRGVPGVDGIRFPDNSVQTTAFDASTIGNGAGAMIGLKVYDTPGDFTWSKPAGLNYVIVETWGGGGAGQDYYGANGTAGGYSRFGPYTRANGGKAATDPTVGGAGGVGYTGDIKLTGGNGSSVQASDSAIAAAGGFGGGSPKGGLGGPGGWNNGTSGLDGTAPGGGGGGAGDRHSAYSPAGGGGGGYAMSYLKAADITANVNVTVGAGGVGVDSYNDGLLVGGNGGAGMVVVYEYGMPTP